MIAKAKARAKATRQYRARSAFAFAFAFLFTSCSSDHRTVLTVYSPHGLELLGYFEKEFEKAHPEIDVQWVDMGAQEVYERVSAEGPNPQSDIWFGGPAEAFDRAARRGLLDPYTPTWADKVPASAHDPENRWYGTYLTPEVIAYNAHAVTAADAPKDWDDVLDPKWKGKLLIRDPNASGTMRAIFGAQMLRGIRDSGTVQAGYHWLARLDANTKEYVLNPVILYQKIGREEGTVTLWDMPDIATLEQRTGIKNIAYVVPSSGTPELVEGIAIVHGAKHPDAAKLFYEFVTTREAEVEAANKYLRIPVRSDVPRDSLPKWIQDAMTNVKPMPLDNRMLADSLDTWMTYWDANIRNRYRK